MLFNSFRPYDPHKSSRSSTRSLEELPETVRAELELILNEQGTIHKDKKDYFIRICFIFIEEPEQYKLLKKKWQTFLEVLQISSAGLTLIKQSLKTQDERTIFYDLYLRKYFPVRATHNPDKFIPKNFFEAFNKLLENKIFSLVQLTQFNPDIIYDLDELIHLGILTQYSQSSILILFQQQDMIKDYINLLKLMRDILISELKSYILNNINRLTPFYIPDFQANAWKSLWTTTIWPFIKPDLIKKFGPIFSQIVPLYYPSFYLSVCNISQFFDLSTVSFFLYHQCDTEKHRIVGHKRKIWEIHTSSNFVTTPFWSANTENIYPLPQTISHPSDKEQEETIKREGFYI